MYEAGLPIRGGERPTVSFYDSGGPSTNNNNTSTTLTPLESDQPQPLQPARRHVSPLQYGNVRAGDDSDVKVVLKQNGAPPAKTKPEHNKHFSEPAPPVYIRVVFMKIGEVDTVKETFEADVFIHAKWREPALDSVERSLKKRRKIKWGNFWSPAIVVQNLIETENNSKKVLRDVEVTPSGESFAVEKRRIKGTFSESMELQNFPFDTQHLSLVLTSEQPSVQFVENNSEPSLVDHSTFTDEQEWLIRDIVEFANDVKHGEFSSLHPMAPVMLVRIHATRRYGFFVWNILAMMVLICSLILCTFSVARSHPSNRLQLSFTLVLTGVAFKFVSNQSLPKISYLTILDKYILNSMVLMHLVCVWHACVGLTSDSSSLANTLDLIAFFVFIAAFIIYQVIFAIVVKYKEKLKKMMGEGYLESRRHDEMEKKKKQGRFLPDFAEGIL